ncbi:phospho-N-acetylmuramoyl-pentapeptide-transferase [Stackebrandtia albiflava]|uniref:Phospho-N-acetylmuramoyl-pentapeptide-transferase n=1 Tax=Stackebrandtia albiflava TaxID=406432 RepID=A0A562VBL7_9ACTN|nr:phospho-N-acetylmuramoyl-pentapeptide-transferase [Stackebrandtia albiflava]TWJ15273.1 phospho-N-acetylmuramoyl-pentapeptide-transferase [Stackebrandtia albiflava]
MRAVIVAAFVAFTISLFFTPLAVKGFRRLKAGQPIRTDGPQTHLTKQGTPTMGGVVFILATVLAYLAGHAVLIALPEGYNRPQGFTATGIVLIGLFVCMGLVGFIDDFLKIRRKNSGGLNKRAKLFGQIIVAAGFGYMALNYEGSVGMTVASDHLSFVRDIDWAQLSKVGAVIMFVFVVIATSNGVNLTDGLDGLATGASIMALAAYIMIAFWQYRHWCYSPNPPSDLYCYEIRDPLEIALIAGAAAGACFGFLWWNTSPAQIFMGDTGALGLGGLIGGLALSTKTIMLLPIIGALFVIITFSVIIQVISYKTTKRRVFRMAPLQHHFELAGWSEVNIVVRFWIVAGIGVAIGIGLFYADFLQVAG